MIKFQELTSAELPEVWQNLYRLREVNLIADTAEIGMLINKFQDFESNRYWTCYEGDTLVGYLGFESIWNGVAQTHGLWFDRMFVRERDPRVHRAIGAIMDILGLHMVRSIFSLKRRLTKRMMDQWNWQFEGMLREWYWVGDIPYDALSYSITRKELQDGWEQFEVNTKNRARSSVESTAGVRPPVGPSPPFPGGIESAPDVRGVQEGGTEGNGSVGHISIEETMAGSPTTESESEQRRPVESEPERQQTPPGLW